MPIKNIIDSEIKISQASVVQTGFGTALVAVTLTGPQDTLWTGLVGSNVTYDLTQGGWPDELEAIGFADGEPLWEWATLHFGQSPSPERAVVGKLSTAVAQVVTFTVATGAALTPDGTYTATINGTAFSHGPTVGETGNQVRDALIALINAGPTKAEPVTAAPGADGVFTVTADSAGIPFTGAATAPSPADMTALLTTPNVGLSTDIDLWNAERTDWYNLHELTQDPDTIKSGADVVEFYTRDLLGTWQVSEVSEPGADDAGDSTDVGSVLQALKYARSSVSYSARATDQVIAGLAGRALPELPGSLTWALKKIVGLEGDVFSSAQVAALNAKNYTRYELFEAQDIALSQHARVADGTPIDLIRGRDSLNFDLRLAIVDYLSQQNKVSYTDVGAAELANVVKGVLDRYAARGFLIAETITITFPSAASQAPADRAARIFRGFTWSATAQGAIESMELSGTIVV